MRAIVRQVSRGSILGHHARRLRGCLTARWKERKVMDFFKLVSEGTPQSVHAAIDQGADVNAQDPLYGLTALMWAARFNQNPEVITILLKAGADVNMKDANGCTPLLWAAWGNQNPEVITILLRAGADAKAKNNQEKTAFDNAQANEKLKGTDAYRQLQQASR